MRRVTLIHLINVRGCRMFSLPWSIEGFGLSKIYDRGRREMSHRIPPTQAVPLLRQNYVSFHPSALYNITIIR